LSNAPVITNCNTLFLDAGGVLVWPNWERIANVLQAHGIHADPSQLAAANPLVRKSFDAAEVPAAPIGGLGRWRYFDLVLAKVGIPPSEATATAMSVLREYHRTENLWEYVPGFVPPALQRLRKLGTQLVVVSNSNGTLMKAFDRLGLSSMVDLIIDSADVGVEKPDRRIFDIAMKRSGADRKTTIHAGDLYRVDVKGARAAGLVGVLVDEANIYPESDCLRVRSVAELSFLIGSASSNS
jgi:putative hydrolase of the HAD superfamily